MMLPQELSPDEFIEIHKLHIKAVIKTKYSNN